MAGLPPETEVAANEGCATRGRPFARSLPPRRQRSRQRRPAAAGALQPERAGPPHRFDGTGATLWFREMVGVSCVFDYRYER